MHKLPLLSNSLKKRSNIYDYTLNRCSCLIASFCSSHFSMNPISPFLLQPPSSFLPLFSPLLNSPLFFSPSSPLLMSPYPPLRCSPPSHTSSFFSSPSLRSALISISTFPLSLFAPPISRPLHPPPLLTSLPIKRLHPSHPPFYLLSPLPPLSPPSTLPPPCSPLPPSPAPLLLTFSPRAKWSSGTVNKCVASPADKRNTHKRT